MLRSVTFQDIHPPLDVIDAYRDVSRASSDRQRRINEAIAYRDKIVTEAKGKAEALVQSAVGEQSRRVALAAGAADAFNCLRLARGRSLTHRHPALLGKSGRKPRGQGKGRSRRGAGPPAAPDRPEPRLGTHSTRSDCRWTREEGGRRSAPAKWKRTVNTVNGECEIMRPLIRWLFAIGLFVVLAAGVAACVFAVDESEFAILTSFGRIVGVYGEQPGDAGLHFKAPWQLAQKIDKRLRVFEPPPREVITGDKRNLEIAAFVVWRVANPVLFVRAAGGADMAEARLHERVAASVSNAVGRRDLEALASTERGRWALDDLTREVAASVLGLARSELGVLVSDVRLRRFNHPIEVRPAVFDLIRSEADRSPPGCGPKARHSTSRSPARPTGLGTRSSPRPNRTPSEPAVEAKPRRRGYSTKRTRAIPNSSSSFVRSKRTDRSLMARRPWCSPHPAPCSAS